MSELTENSHLQSNITMPVIRGEIALIVIILINSLGVVLMLYSGSGISAISSVPYAFSLVFSKIFSFITDDHEKEIRCTVSFQFLSGICIQ